MNFWNDLFTLTVIGVIAAGFFYMGKSGGLSIVNFQKKQADKSAVKKEWIIFGIIMVVACVIRLWQFGQYPYGMNQDGAMGAIDAKALADHGTDRLGMYMPVHLQAWGFGQMSALMSYLTVPFIWLFGLNPVSARLPILIVSCLALWVLYLLLKEVFDILTAQIGLALASLSPWHFIQSRWSLDCNLFPHMILFGVFFLIKAIKSEKKRKLMFCISMFFFAMSMYCYGISIYTIPLLLLISCIYLIVKKMVSIKEIILCVVVYLFFAWPFILTMIINTFKLESIETPLFTIPFFPGSQRAADILFFSDNFSEQLINNIKSLWNVMTKGEDAPWNAVYGFSTIYICSFPLVVVGIYSVKQRFKKYKADRPSKIKKNTSDNKADFNEEDYRIASIVILGFWFLISIWSGLITSSVNINRENILIYIMMIIAAVGARFVIEKKHKLVYVLLAVLCINGLFFVSAYFSEDHANALKSNYLGGFGECMRELRDAGCEKYYVDLDCQESKAGIVLELQTLFYLEVDSKEYQSPEFREKYKFVTTDEFEFSDDVKIGYVLPDTDERNPKTMFDKNKFTFINHGPFVAVIPKS